MKKLITIACLVLSLVLSGEVFAVDGVTSPELVTDGGFDNWSGDELDSWNETRGDAAEVGDYAEFTRNADGGSGTLAQVVTLTAGKIYTVSSTIKNGTATSVKLWMDNSVSGDVSSESVTATKDINIQFNYTCPAAGTNSIKFYILGGDGTTGYVSRVSVKLSGTTASKKSWCDDPDTVLCLAMSANGGNETDLSSYGNTVTETGGTIPTATYTRPPLGVTATGRDFTASESEYLDIANGSASAAALTAANAMTVCAVVQLETDTGADQKIITSDSLILKFDDSDDDFFFGIKNTVPSWISVKFADNSAYEGESHHWCGTWDGTSMTLYKDGELGIGPTAKTGPLATVTVLDTGVDVDGILDDVIILKRALTAVEIRNLYVNGLGE